MNQQNASNSDKPYKSEFVDFIKSKEWHWFITIPIGLCPHDETVLKRLRAIEAVFCGKYLVNRYHKLSNEARFSMVVAFEGESKLGTRHAHILAYIPPSSKKRISRSMLISLFPFEFRFLWNKLGLLSAPNFEKAWMKYPWEGITFGTVNVARAIYPAKDVRQVEVPWSRFEFVTPPKFKAFNSENRRLLRDRDKHRRACLEQSRFL